MDSEDSANMDLRRTDCVEANCQKYRPYIEVGRNTVDDSKQATNWGRSLQSIDEEVGTGRQCGM